MANASVKGLIMAKLIWLQYRGLSNVRRSHKGLKLGHVWAIGLIGFDDVIRVGEAAKRYGVSRSLIHNRFERCVKAGVLYKVKLGHYALTEKGRNVFELLNAEIGAGLDRIADEVLKEVKSRL